MANNTKATHCVCCKKKLEVYGDADHGWVDGDVVTLKIGYGSRLDGDVYSLAICTNCIIDRTQKGIIISNGRYFS
jgi:hypothetical protein